MKFILGVIVGGVAAYVAFDQLLRREGYVPLREAPSDEPPQPVAE